MKTNALLLIASLSILAVSCHSQKTTSDAPANQPKTAAIEQNAANPEVQSAEQVAPPADAPTACGIGSKQEGDQCVCGEMKLPVTDNGHWACIGDILRCLRADGCFYKGKRYPQLTEIRQGTAYCGHTQAPEQPEGFICTDNAELFISLVKAIEDAKSHHPVFEAVKDSEIHEYLNKIFPKHADSLWWVCNAEEPNSCKCHGITASKGEVCTADGLLANNGGIYRTQEDKDTNNPSCGDFKYQDLKLKGKENLRCFDGQWDCEKSLMYADNTWQCMDYEISNSCNGIELPVRDKTQGKDIYDCQGDWCTSLNRYECRFGKWVCEADKCDCLSINDTGEEKYISIQYGDICDTSRYYQDESLAGVHDSSWEDISSVCVNGNCPCGDGACPQFSICKEGHCFVDNGIYQADIGTDWGQFYSTVVLYEESDDYDPELYLPLLVCLRNEGCLTPSGQHFNYHAVFPGKAYASSSDDRSTTNVLVDDDLQFHLHAYPETPVPQIVHNGECVLDIFKCTELRVWTEERYSDSIHDLNICKRHLSDGQEMDHTPTDSTHCYGSSSERVDYDHGSFEEQSVRRNAGVYVYNVSECKDGHRYCNGLNNAPQLEPKDHVGYRCLTVYSIPGNSATNNLKSWVCIDEKGCQCGNEKCGENKACIDEKCVALSRKATIESQNLKTVTEPPKQQCPLNNDDPDYYDYYFDGRSYYTSNSYGYWKGIPRCGYKYRLPECEEAITIITDDDYHYETSGCVYAGEYVFDLYNDVELLRCNQGKYSSGKGCLCGKSYIKDIISYDCLHENEQYYEVCRLSKGCPCGDNLCPNSTACVQGQCIDPLTNAPLSGSRDVPSLGCHEGNHCACGESTCEEGEFCLNGKCQSRIYARIAHHQRVNYRMESIFAYRSGHNVYAHAGTEVSYLYDPPIPDTTVPDGYSVMPEIICIQGSGGVECDGEAAYIHLRCDREDGCACGETICPMGAECKDNQCIFDTQYADFWCFTEDNSYATYYQPVWGELVPPRYGEYREASFGVKIDSKGHCLCNGSVLMPKLGNHHSQMYDCTRFGWTCKIEDGCECGDAKCPKNSVCIAPGVCSDAFQCSAAECEKDGVCQAPGNCSYY